MMVNKVSEKQKEEIANLRLFLAGLTSIWIGSVVGLTNALINVQEKPVLVIIVILLFMALIISNMLIIKCFRNLIDKTNSL